MSRHLVRRSRAKSRATVAVHALGHEQRIVVRAESVILVQPNGTKWGLRFLEQPS